MGTSQQRSSSFQESLAKRAEGYNMAWDVFQGEDLYEVRAKTQIAIDRAHNESEPTLLEIQTYRYYGHSVADANAKKYRTAGRNRAIQGEPRPTPHLEPPSGGRGDPHRSRD